MPKSPKDQKQTSSKTESTVLQKAKFIFNPHAGAKRKLLPNPNSAVTSLEDIKDLLKKYQIPVDYFPTKAPGHATTLVKSAQEEGYKLVIVAGGDGTVGEAVNGLVHSDIPLGIIPLGSFMNIARMLSIPLDIEKAVMLIKIGRSRKIDVGSVLKLSGEKLSEPYYFLESCGMGIEAELHQYFLDLERGSFKAIFKMIKTLFSYYGYPTILTIDNEKVETRAILVNVANGPYSGPAIKLAPKAKLNDHKLTVTQLKLSKVELFRYLFRLATGRKKGYYHRVILDQAKKVKIETKVERPIHADARLYGVTPVEFKIVPNALNIISGFPESKSEAALIKRTLLDP
jgi:diacylglycerol kinase (ATP)